MKEKLLGKTLEELKAACVSCGLKPFVGAQLADWLYVKRVGDWDSMTNIAKSSKEKLAAQFELGTSAAIGKSCSTDGTKKYLFSVDPNRANAEQAGTAAGGNGAIGETGQEQAFDGTVKTTGTDVVTGGIAGASAPEQAETAAGGADGTAETIGAYVVTGGAAGGDGASGAGATGGATGGDGASGAGATGFAVEAVMIPDEDRKTLCVSSQAGCKMGCKFCMTGRQGWHGNLDVADILNQFLSIDENTDLTNAVFMGMGEPLDNYENVSKAIEILTAPWGFAWSPKRITLSTIGVIPNLKRYLDDSRCHLAISLHTPFADEREQMMPVQKAYPLQDVLNLVKQYDFSGQRRISFEYTMFAGVNDDKRHADALIRALSGLECRVNLIRFHKIPDFPYDSSQTGVMEIFRDRLNAHGITCTIRSSRGEDILAACGMLAGKKNLQ